MVRSMTAGMLVLTLVLLAGGAAALMHRRRGRTATVFIVAEPDVALLSSAAALRRLGARITRYDTERGTLEARAAAARVIRLRAAAHDATTTRIDLEGDAGATIRRFRRALSA